VRYNAGQVFVETTTNGNAATPTYTPRGTLTAAFALGDALTALAYSDGSVNVYRNGKFIGRVTGTTFTGGGRIGMQLVTNLTRVDNFSGGSLP
jgi:hypothetical protein